MTRPTSLGRTSPSTAELGPFLNSAADSPQVDFRSAHVLRLHSSNSVYTGIMSIDRVTSAKLWRLPDAAISRGNWVNNRKSTTVAQTVVGSRNNRECRNEVTNTRFTENLLA